MIKLFLFVMLCGALPARAALDIEVTGAGDHQVPIAVVPLDGEEKLTQSISAIVAADLQRSGLFKIVDTGGKLPHEVKEVAYASWAEVGALTVGNVVLKPKGRIAVKYHLLDTVLKTELIGTTVSGKANEIRSLAHRIADQIFEKLTGDRGVFNTRISYVNRQGDKYQLLVADSDGYNEKVIFTSGALIMSPAWSPDGSHLAFVAFENEQAVVYVQSMLTNQHLAVASFPESDTAPAWSPDGQRLAFVISNEGSSHIYFVQPDGTDLQQVTFDDEIDTEPNFSPDGQHIIFESNRSSTVQIYQISVEEGEAERLTFEGRNNFSPHYSPDGKSFVYSSWLEGKFYIALEDIQTKQVQHLTSGGWGKNPSFAPNGKMILYATEADGRGVLATVSLDGRVKQKLFAKIGNILDPAWGPLSR